MDACCSTAYRLEKPMSLRTTIQLVGKHSNWHNTQHSYICITKYKCYCVVYCVLQNEIDIRYASNQSLFEFLQFLEPVWTVDFCKKLFIVRGVSEKTKHHLGKFTDMFFKWACFVMRWPVSSPILKALRCKGKCARNKPVSLQLVQIKPDIFSTMDPRTPQWSLLSMD